MVDRVRIMSTHIPTINFRALWDFFSGYVDNYEKTHGANYNNSNSTAVRLPPVSLRNAILKYLMPNSEGGVEKDKIPQIIAGEPNSEETINRILYGENGALTHLLDVRLKSGLNGLQAFFDDKQAVEQMSKRILGSIASTSKVEPISHPLSPTSEEYQGKLSELAQAKRQLELDLMEAKGSIRTHESLNDRLKARIAELAAELLKKDAELRELREEKTRSPDPTQLEDVGMQTGTTPTSSTSPALGEPTRDIAGYFQHASEDAKNILRLLDEQKKQTTPSPITSGGAKAVIHTLSNILVANRVPFAAKSKFIVHALLILLVMYNITLYLVRSNVIASPRAAGVALILMYAPALALITTRFNNGLPLPMLVAHLVILYIVLAFSLRNQSPKEQPFGTDKLTTRIYTSWIIAVLAVAFL